MALATLALAAACGSGDAATTSGGGCRSTINSAGSTSPNTGFLVVPGVLYSSESVTIGYTLLGHATSVTGIPVGSPSTSITFIGLPSGTQTFTFETTCTGPAPTYAALHGTFPNATVTIK
jgi:hypothetical protein